jgi:signal transduction histidine kinase
VQNRPRSSIGYRRHVFLPMTLLLAVYLLAGGLFFGLVRTAGHSLEQSFDSRVSGAADAIAAGLKEIEDGQRKYADDYLAQEKAARVAGLAAPTTNRALKRRIQEFRSEPMAPLGLSGDGGATASIMFDASRGTDVIQVTVPIDTDEGRRLFTTTIDVQRSMAAAELRRAVAPAGASTAYLRDVRTNRTVDVLPGSSGTTRPDWHVAEAPVNGTSWRVGAVIPATTLFQTFHGLVREFRVVVVLAVVTSFLLVAVAGLAARNRAVRLETARAAERARELETLNASLQAANDRVAGLVGMLTHDVRQPIAAITGYCELMVSDWDTSTDADKRKDVERVAAAAVTMGNLVEEILTLTQLDEDTLVAHRAPLNAYDTTIEALAQLCAAQRDGVGIDVAHQQIHVLADPRHLQQMLGNLISNGMKYGRPPVTVRVTERDAMVDFEVSDSGEGVPADFVPRLFDRYARATTGVAPTKKGTGLGLFIVRELAGANGGSVIYRERSGGACFVLSLPAASRAREMARALERTSGDSACGETVP